MAIVCEEKSIRDVIAFPKSHDGRDLMSHSPTTVLQQDLDAYHIVVKKWEMGPMQKWKINTKWEMGPKQK